MLEGESGGARCAYTAARAGVGTTRLRSDGECADGGALMESVGEEYAGVA